MQIFEQNFCSDKERKRRRDAARQVFCKILPKRCVLGLVSTHHRNACKIATLKTTSDKSSRTGTAILCCSPVRLFLLYRVFNPQDAAHTVQRLPDPPAAFFCCHRYSTIILFPVSSFICNAKHCQIIKLLCVLHKFPHAFPDIRQYLLR